MDLPNGRAATAAMSSVKIATQASFRDIVEVIRDPLYPSSWLYITLTPHIRMLITISLISPFDKAVNLTLILRHQYFGA